MHTYFAIVQTPAGLMNLPLYGADDIGEATELACKALLGFWGAIALSFPLTIKGAA